MAKAKLTGKQRRLVAEVRQLLSTLMLDPDAIIADEDVDGRTPRLELAKDQIIRTAVVSKYALMDELLSALICWHYFGKRRGGLVAEHEPSALGLKPADLLVDVTLPGADRAQGHDLGAAVLRSVRNGDGVLMDVEPDRESFARLFHG